MENIKNSVKKTFEGKFYSVLYILNEINRQSASLSKTHKQRLAKEIFEELKSGKVNEDTKKKEEDEEVTTEETVTQETTETTTDKTDDASTESQPDDTTETTTETTEETSTEPTQEPTLDSNIIGQAPETATAPEGVKKVPSFQEFLNSGDHISSNVIKKFDEYESTENTEEVTQKLDPEQVVDEIPQDTDASAETAGTPVEPAETGTPETTEPAPVDTTIEQTENQPENTEETKDAKDPLDLNK